MQTITIIQTTVSSIEAAKELASKLVEAKRAGCVQIDGPISRIYNWQGNWCDESEYRLTCKTTHSLRQLTVDFLNANHPYEVPEIIVSDVEVSESYATWLASQVTE
jgi:periplasmic divalent cation tolerance protein